MIKQLGKIFSSLISYKGNDTNTTDLYQWFITDKGEVIGISKDELTDKDFKLLSTFLRPYNKSIPEMTREEMLWGSYVKGECSDDAIHVPSRFIFFSFQKFQIEPCSFKEAINEFFAKQVPILWENNHEGVIIETNPDQDFSYKQIIDVLMSDLYVKINILIGPYLHTIAEAQNSYQALVKNAAIVFTYSESAVTSYMDAIPFILIDQTEESVRANIINTVLGETATDDELMKTINMFLTCNLNMTLTAKELYLHRNSLQYRLDKFTQKTGIDIRQFHQAMAVYLALLAKK